jgi:hypothetical protein
MERSYRTDGDWRVICEQLLTESDPERFIELLRQLNDALEKPRLRSDLGTAPENQESA